MHGYMCPDHTAILSTFQAHLNSGPLKTFEELSHEISEWLQNNDRLYVILQAFERFATTAQHFLYSLFELAATERVYVVCCSTRCDVVDLLEKRVKSRFSQNTIYLPLPKTFTEYCDTIKSVLDGDIKNSGKKWKKYHDSVEKVMRDEDILEYLECKYQQDHDPLAALYIFAESLLRCTGASLDVDLIHSNVAPQDEVIDGLSVAEWCVLIAIRRARQKNPEALVNFDVLFDEYRVGFAASAKINDGAMWASKFTRPIIHAAVDTLITKGWLRTSKSDTGETVDTREELYTRIPLGHLPELLASVSNNCPSPLKKLATEIL